MNDVSKQNLGSPNGFMRSTQWVAGYDCRQVCTRHQPPSTGHGQHCDDWYYALVTLEGDVALVLHVLSGIYPSKDERGPDGGPRPYPSAGGLSLHATFTTDPEAIRVGGTPNPHCEYLGAPCYDAGTWLCYADDFWRKNSVGQEFEQPESFWLAFEEEFKRRVAEVRAERADKKFKQCERCKGSGLEKISP